MSEEALLPVWGRGIWMKMPGCSAYTAPSFLFMSVRPHPFYPSLWLSFASCGDPIPLHAPLRARLGAGVVQSFFPGTQTPATLHARRAAPPQSSEAEGFRPRVAKIARGWPVLWTSVDAGGTECEQFGSWMWKQESNCPSRLRARASAIKTVTRWTCYMRPMTASRRRSNSLGELPLPADK